MVKKLGTLERCEIRKTWNNENDFSDWLMEEQNLALLCTSIGIDEISDPSRENNVGSFRADITGEIGDVAIVIET